MLLMIPLFASTAMANEPPTSPTIQGPSSGKPGTPVTYKFTSTDPEGEDISYCPSWGDGSGECSDFNPSGEPVSMMHTYDAKGTYTITVIAKDIHEAESDPSTFVVTMPRSRFIPHMFISRFFQQYPNAFPILQHLLGL